MQAKVCWTINGDTHPDQCVMRDCGLIPIMVRVRVTFSIHARIDYLTCLSRFDATCAGSHLPNLFGDMKSRKNLVVTSSSTEMRGLSDTLLFPGVTMSHPSSAPPLLTVVRLIPSMPFKFVAPDWTSPASPIPFTTSPTGVLCSALAGENRNTSSPSC